jgi:hypothetical protein
MGPDGSNMSVVAKSLLLVSLLEKNGRLDSEEKSRLKELALREDKLFIAAMQVFEINADLEDAADTLRKILRMRYA